MSHLHSSLLTSTDIDKLVSVKGMVIRCSSIIPEIKGAFFKCLVCGHSPQLLSVVKGNPHYFEVHFSWFSYGIGINLLNMHVFGGRLFL